MENVVIDGGLLVAASEGGPVAIALRRYPQKGTGPGAGTGLSTWLFDVHSGPSNEDGDVPPLRFTIALDIANSRSVNPASRRQGAVITPNVERLTPSATQIGGPGTFGHAVFHLGYHNRQPPVGRELSVPPDLAAKMAELHRRTMRENVELGTLFSLTGDGWNSGTIYRGNAVSVSFQDTVPTAGFVHFHTHPKLPPELARRGGVDIHGFFSAQDVVNSAAFSGISAVQAEGGRIHIAISTDIDDRVRVSQLIIDALDYLKLVSDSLVPELFSENTFSNYLSSVYNNRFFSGNARALRERTRIKRETNQSEFSTFRNGPLSLLPMGELITTAALDAFSRQSRGQPAFDLFSGPIPVRLLRSITKYFQTENGLPATGDLDLQTILLLQRKYVRSIIPDPTRVATWYDWIPFDPKSGRQPTSENPYPANTQGWVIRPTTILLAEVSEPDARGRTQARIRYVPEFPNGDFRSSTYQGSLLHWKRHGRGRWEQDGFVFDGEFSSEFPNGQGSRTTPSGLVEVGEFRDGLLFRGTQTRGRERIRVETINGQLYRVD